MTTTPVANKGPNGDGWAEYRRLVLAELERISQESAKAVQQGTAIQLALAQALSDARSSLLDKIRETANKLNDDHEKKLAGVERESERKVQILETKYIGELKVIREALDQQGRDISALKAKSALLGAVAGFLVALAGLLVSIFIKKP